MTVLTDRFDYSDIRDGLSLVRVFNADSGKSFRLQLALDEVQLLQNTLRPMRSEFADLVDFSIAVYLVDRIAPRRADMQRNIQITLPLRHPETFNRSEIKDRLSDVLYWFTTDHWSFDFRRRASIGREAEMHMSLSESLSSWSNQEREVALWSGGLDSLAGLWNRISSRTAQDYLLFGTGDNPQILHVQRAVSDGCKFSVAKEERVGIRLTQASWSVIDHGAMPRNSRARTRGLVFMLLGAVCASLAGQNKLHIYENGIGAINLPYRESEIGADHSRSVHPLSLIMMEKLLSVILGRDFFFDNPFLFKTKAQMVAGLNEGQGLRLVNKTISCDGLLREKVRQCGWCTSCLLRRQALTASRLEDLTRYSPRAVDLSGGNHQLHGEPLSAMRHQVATFKTILNGSTPFRTMASRFPDLSETVVQLAKHECLTRKEVEDRLIGLFGRYVAEWGSILDGPANTQPIQPAIQLIHAPHNGPKGATINEHTRVP
jgi:7-cyano-7-deazaguanine synthase in queuosine biosynthesis